MPRPIAPRGIPMPMPIFAPLERPPGWEMTTPPEPLVSGGAVDPPRSMDVVELELGIGVDEEEEDEAVSKSPSRKRTCTPEAQTVPDLIQVELGRVFFLVVDMYRMTEVVGLAATVDLQRVSPRVKPGDSS